MLDKVRSGALAASPRLVDLVLKAVDHIRELLAGSPGDGPAHPPPEALIAAIEEFAKGGLGPGGGCARGAAPRADPAPAGEQSWSIQFRPSPTLFACGGNPIALFRELRKLGTCEVTAHTEDLPALDAMTARK